jgi:HlyD family secretion protein
MKIQFIVHATMIISFLSGCNWNKNNSDASGTFEADEVIVSSEVPGKILILNIDEGSVIAKDSTVGIIDSVPLLLQKAQLEASINSLRMKTMDVEPQVKFLEEQIATQKIQLADLINERDRTIRLIKADAATTKQLDDYNNQIEVLKKQIDVNMQQINVQKTSVGTQNSTVMSEYRPLTRSVAQIEDQLNRTYIKNPVNGTVLTKYAMAGEYTTVGKALYKIADLSVITLRAYITGTQISQVKLNQTVKVLVDSSEGGYRHYSGVITWISDKAEFTPKTIQTKDERANLVYAIKIHVINDGFLKIGMYGEVKFN